MTNDLAQNIGPENNQRGFVATITVVVLAFSIVAIVVVVSGAVDKYVDSVYLYELRIYARQSLSACLTTAEKTLASDYFLRGQVNLPEYGCEISVQDYGGQMYQVALSIVVEYGPVKMKVSETIRLFDYHMEVIDRRVED